MLPEKNVLPELQGIVKYKDGTPSVDLKALGKVMYARTCIDYLSVSRD